jgi:hypothetical protein
MLTKNKHTPAGLLNLSTQDGKLVMTKGNRFPGIILAPALIVFFPHVRAGLRGMIGKACVILVGAALFNLPHP